MRYLLTRSACITTPNFPDKSDFLKFSNSSFVEILYITEVEELAVNFNNFKNIFNNNIY